MLVLTIQEESVVKKLLNGNYTANIWKSPYACQSMAFMRGYRIILDELNNRSSGAMLEDDSCFWGWVKNPYIDFFNNRKEKYIALFVDIPKQDLVLSDYDKYTSYVLENSSNSDFIVNDLSEADCVQCSFARVFPSNVRLAVPLELLSDMNGTISDMYISTLIKLQWISLVSKVPLVLKKNG